MQNLFSCGSEKGRNIRFCENVCKAEISFQEGVEEDKVEEAQTGTVSCAFAICGALLAGSSKHRAFIDPLPNFPRLKYS